VVDKAAEGLVGETFEMDLERGKIREFANATQSDHPAYREGETPVIPATFLTTQFYWEEAVEGANPWDRVKMSQKRGMHAEQEYLFHGPPPKAGTRLTCKSRIDSIFEKQGRSGGSLTFVVRVTEFRDETGRLVAEAKLTGVETGRPPGDKS
jgi:hypothetical protein